MGVLKQLGKDTAIYGLSSIVGRFLNWGLVPLYTHVFSQGQYGVVTAMYAYVAVALVILTYGMETGFFRFANHERWKDPREVYSTTLFSLGATSLLFLLVSVAWARPIADFMQCPAHPEYVVMMCAVLAIDAFTSMPFAYLRYRKRALRYATIKCVNIGLNIGLNLFFIVACPALWGQTPPAWAAWFYSPTFGIGYIFLSNLIASIATLLMLLPVLTGFRWQFNGRLWREMLTYSWPLLLLGIAGIMNQNLGQLVYTAFAAGRPGAIDELGIYGANYKVAIIMVMFTQAFRFAYEPLVFARARQAGANDQMYGQAMKYFIIFCLLCFLAVMYYLDILRYFIAPKFWPGLAVVPIVMAGEVFSGVYFNLSFWYKLADKTIWGLWFTLLGLAVALAINFWGIPRYGYMACAWGTFASYGVMMVASYLVGQRIYPIAYPLRRIGLYVLLFVALYYLGLYCLPAHGWFTMTARALLLMAYVAVIARCEGLAKLIRARLHR